MVHNIGDKKSRRSIQDAIKGAVKSGESDSMEVCSRLWSAHAEIASDEPNIERALSHARIAKDRAEQAACWANDVVF